MKTSFTESNKISTACLQAVDSFGVELILDAVVYAGLQVDHSEYFLVRGRFEDPHPAVSAREDAGDMSTRRRETAADDAQPGIIKSAIDRLRLSQGQAGALLQNLLGRAPRQSIEDGQPVALLGAMRKHLSLHLRNRRDIRIVIRQTQTHRIGRRHQIEVIQRRQGGDGVLQGRRPVSVRIGPRHVTADAAVVEEAIDDIGQIAFRPAAKAGGEFFLTV